MFVNGIFLTLINSFLVVWVHTTWNAIHVSNSFKAIAYSLTLRYGWRNFRWEFHSKCIVSEAFKCNSAVKMRSLQTLVINELFLHNCERTCIEVIVYFLQYETKGKPCTQYYPNRQSKNSGHESPSPSNTTDHSRRNKTISP